MAASGEHRMKILLRAVAQGRDRRAFGELFAFFAPRIKAFMMRGGADADAAEELAQEAMIQVWRRAAVYDPARAAASTWIFAIARNKRIDRLRRERRSDIDDDEYAATLSAPAHSEDVVQAEDSERALAKAIDALSPEQAQVVRMAFYEDKPHAAIAAELRLPLGTVKSRIRLALGRLRTLVEKKAA